MSSSKRQRPIGNEPSDEVIELQPLLDREPKHFLLKVESFSVLSESKMEKYESDEFEVDGCKWRLILYPKGDKKGNGANHISLYLSISDTNILPQGWEIKAHFSLFVYNSISDKYLTYKVGNENAPRRFHGLKKELGFARFVALDKFSDASNGYIFNDTCVFGAEISVISRVPKRQCISMIKETNNKTFTWNVHKFSAIKVEFLYSDKFKIGGLQWRLLLYPQGFKDGKGKSISVFLESADDELKKLGVNWKVYAEYKLRIRNQVNNSKHVKKQVLTHWFSNNLTQPWGYNNLMPLSDVNDKSKGFLKNDTLVVEVDINIVAMTKNFD